MVNTAAVVQAIYRAAGIDEQQVLHLAEVTIHAARTEKTRDNSPESIHDIAVKLAHSGAALVPRLRAKAHSAQAAGSVDVLAEILAEADNARSPTTGKTFGELRSGVDPSLVLRDTGEADK